MKPYALTTRRQLLALAVASLFLPTVNASAQHIYWVEPKTPDSTCLYGEITVLATNPTTYYCGANWHPGEPAGGYCGIQDNTPTERRTIFSIWDTSPTLHPSTTEADRETQTSRFGGEGTGGHTHLIFPWKVGDTFHFFVQKSPGASPDSTDTRYYIFDPKLRGWRHIATINNPNGGQKCVTTFGNPVSFLENFSGKERDVPKLAIYRLWAGTSIDKMQCLTKVSGDGKWGELHDAFFMAEGDPAKLNEVFAQIAASYGSPMFAGAGKLLPPISDKPLPPELVAALSQLSSAPKVPTH